MYIEIICITSIYIIKVYNIIKQSLGIHRNVEQHKTNKHNPTRHLHPSHSIPSHHMAIHKLQHKLKYLAAVLLHCTFDPSCH